MRALKRILLWLIAGVILITVFNQLGSQNTNRISYSAFITEIQNNNVESVTIAKQDVQGVLKNHQTFSTHLLQPISDDSPLTKEMLDKKIIIKGVDAEQNSLLFHLLNLLPWVIAISALIFARRRNKS